MNNLMIPVQIDSIKRMEDFQRTRCIYYRIGFDQGHFSLPFFFSPNDLLLSAMWGNWAVLIGPGNILNTDGFFNSPESISSALKIVDASDNMFLDLCHIWLPNEKLNMRRKNQEIRIGDVYRLSPTLFRQCYCFVAGMITENEWLDSCKTESEDIRYSLEETASFRLWRKQQIQQSKDRYHDPEYAGRRLPKKESSN